MNQCLRLFIILSAFLVSACGSIGPRCAAIPDAGQYCLQSSSQGPVLDMQQKVDIHYKNRHESMIAYISNDSKKLELVGLTPFGQKFLHIQDDNQRINILASPDSRMSPLLILALFQMALWPADSVREGAGSQLVLEESAGLRQFLHDRKIVMEITYPDRSNPFRQLRMVLPASGLELDIMSLEIEEP